MTVDFLRVFIDVSEITLGRRFSGLYGDAFSSMYINWFIFIVDPFVRHVVGYYGDTDVQLRQTCPSLLPSFVQ